MKFPLFHPLKKGDFHLPEGFPDPFLDIPHPVACAAAEDLMLSLEKDPLFGQPGFEGKMMGVLVVRHPASQELGYLAAFSGNLTLPDARLTNRLPGFVPPIVDLLDPDGFFKQEEAKISELNQTLEGLLNDPVHRAAATTWEEAELRLQHERTWRKEQLKADKAERDHQRCSQPLSETEKAHLIRASQFAKAEFRRWEKAQQEALSNLKQGLESHRQQCEEIRQERALRSQTLEQKIFKTFQLTNGLNEWQSVWDLSQQAPGGTGECAAPKLLQYAWIHGYQPIALAEFWWGRTSNNELRYHKHYYGACRGKCGFILPFMTRGLLPHDPGSALAPNAILPLQQTTVLQPKTVLWEDECLLVVNKPSGMLSLPGKDGSRSLLEHLNDSRPTPLYPVHRLDRDTSGLLVFAKTPEAQRHLQRQFEEQQVAKEYIAILEAAKEESTTLLNRTAQQQCGSLSLPLAPDWVNRPRQCVDFQNGKPSLTHYEFVDHARIRFFPITGRTHQLRVHAAHHLGLNRPILSDSLYGSHQEPNSRLYLHACRIALLHPATQQPLCLYSPPEF